jgi:hypothetical protein
LQDWGIPKQEKLGGGEKSIARYTYSEAFKHQKDLYNHVLVLNQSIENLQNFLKNESKLRSRQNILMNTGITTMLIMIL